MRKGSYKMKTYSRVCAKINLNHITYNIEQMRHHISPDTNMILVVKADGYGHGAKIGLCMGLCHRNA